MEERLDYIRVGHEENWYVIGHRDGRTSVVLAATFEREEAERYRAMFEEHLEGYSSVTVDVAGGLNAWDIRQKLERRLAKRGA